MTTINGTITAGNTAQWQAALNASASVQIANGGGANPIIVACNGAPAGRRTHRRFIASFGSGTSGAPTSADPPASENRTLENPRPLCYTLFT